MRWTRKPAPRHEDTRKRAGFLVLPKTIRRETRWLEHAEWEEVYVVGEHNDTGEYITRQTWDDYRWLND